MHPTTLLVSEWNAGRAFRLHIQRYKNKHIQKSLFDLQCGPGYQMWHRLGKVSCGPASGDARMRRCQPNFGRILRGCEDILYHTRISALVELPLAVSQPLLPMLVMLGTPAASAPRSLRTTLTTVGISTRWWPVHVPVPAARWIVSVASGWRRGVWVTVRFSASSASAVATVVGPRAIAGDVGIDIGCTSATSTGCCYRRRQWWTAAWWQVRPTWKICWWRR